MRLVTWNCRGGFHRKWEHLLALAPDIAIIQECAAPEVILEKTRGFTYRTCDWCGEGAKGLAVYTFGEWTLARDASWRASFHNFLPVRIGGPAAINLLAVWAFNARARRVVPNPLDTREALAYYLPFLTEQLSFVAGDFNASVEWDRPSGRFRFAEVDSDLRRLGLTSGYHETSAEKLGAEREKTHFHASGRDFHIDYIYHPADIASAVTTIGARTKWVGISDHAPVSLELAEATLVRTKLAAEIR